MEANISVNCTDANDVAEIGRILYEFPCARSASTYLNGWSPGAGPSEVDMLQAIERIRRSKRIREVRFIGKFFDYSHREDGPCK